MKKGEREQKLTEKVLLCPEKNSRNISEPKNKLILFWHKL